MYTLDFAIHSVGVQLQPLRKGFRIASLVAAAPALSPDEQRRASTFRKHLSTELYDLCEEMIGVVATGVLPHQATPENKVPRRVVRPAAALLLTATCTGVAGVLQQTVRRPAPVLHGT